MKNLKFRLIPVLIVVAISALVSSCWKKFDASSYAPPLNINGYTSSSQIASSSLVARWGFNGDLKDSISGTTGVATGTSFANGLEGQALQGADNAYVISKVPAAIQGLHSFTVSFWVNTPQNTVGAEELLSIVNPQGFWSNLDVYFNGGSTTTSAVLDFHVFNNGTSGTGTDAWLTNYTVNNPFNAWVNITLTYDDTKSAFVPYYNGGALVGAPIVVSGFAPLNWAGVQNMTFGTFPFQATPSLTAGATAQSWAQFNTGQTDEVRFYNRVLTQTEISSLVALQHRGK